MALGAACLRLAFPPGPGLWLLGVAGATMAWLLMPALRAGPLALDEHVSYWMLDSELPGTVYSRCLDYGAVPPLGSWVQAASLRLFGRAEWALRLPSLIAAWLSLVVVYQLGRSLPGISSERRSLCGGVAACLLACHPDVMDEVRIGRSYGLVLCLATVLLLVTFRWRERIESWRRAAAWAGAASALLWTHYTTAILVAITWGFVALAVLRSSRRGVAGRNLAVATLLCGVACIPLWPAIERLREWGPYLNMLAPESSVWKTISSFWWLALPLGGLSSVVLNTMTSRTSRAAREPGLWRTESGWLLLACSLLPLVMIAIFAVGDLSSLANPRYRVAYAPAGALWVALLLARAESWKPAMVGLIVAVCASWFVQPLRPWQLGRLGSPADSNWRELSLLISEQGNPGEPVFVQCGLVESSLVPAYLSDPMFMEYAACRVSKFYLPAAHSRIALPYFWDEATQLHYKDYLMTQSPPVIWIACATDTDLNRGSLVGIQQIADVQGYRVGSQTTWPNAILLKMTR